MINKLILNNHLNNCGITTVFLTARNKERFSVTFLLLNRNKENKGGFEAKQKNNNEQNSQQVQKRGS